MTESSGAVEIRSAASPADLAEVAALFREYADGLGFPLDFQDFESELRRLPGEYVRPGGALGLARVDGRAAGCVALRPLSDAVCEMKRLYVRPEFRRAGLGRALADWILREARASGYARLRLDTVGTMHGALRLYRSMGFVPIPPYRFNPMPGAVYLELRL